MNWYQRNRSFLLAAVAIAAFGVVFMFDSPAASIIRGTTRSATAIIWQAAYSAREATDYYGGISLRVTLAAENKRLQTEIARLRTLSLHNDILRIENETLRDVLKLREAYSKGITASVLSNPSSSPYGTFVIGAGSADGVVKGAYVLGAPRIALGIIVDVDEYTALVELFSAPGKITEVIVGDARVSYVGRGDGNGLVVVPRGVVVQKEDAVRMSGGPFAIGFVGVINNSPEDAETSILVRVPVNFSALSFVEVVSLR